MGRVAVTTDSNSGITQSMARDLGIRVLPMPFYINGEIFLEDISLTQDEFYEKLSDDSAEISTSQPAPGDVLDLWNGLLEDYDEIVHIPMSSGLSGACQAAMMLAEDYNGRVQVVNNQRISVTQRQSVLDAMELADMGKTAAEIREILEKQKFESSIYISVGTLKYLKKGGRITPAAAAVGAVLKIRPVLQIQGEKLDAYSKCRGIKAAKKTMIEAIQKTIDQKFAGLDPVRDLHLAAAYGHNAEEARVWREELMEAFPGMDCYMAPLSLSVSCHIGPEALAATITRRLHI